ncbi:MAG TPA: glycosyltransferase family 4 protein [Alphaproteobacteria bacterium]|nr:glycosyltransferase family 4 protein [Alphaproteobacteria bacterium]
MHILFCNYEYPPLGGGGGFMNALLAQELARCHQVTVLTSKGPRLPRERLENDVTVVRVPVFCRRQEAVANLFSMLAFVPMGIKAGRELLRAHRFDVINTHFVLPTGPVGNALSRQAGIPNVLSLHGGDLYDPSKFLSPHRHPLLRLWIKRLLSRADLVVGQSKNTLENVRRLYAPTLNGALIPLGIQRPRSGAASRQAYGLAEEDMLLVTIGRLIARKAVTQLIALMDRLRGERVRLLIIGTGPQAPLLKQEALKRRLADRVLFLGQVAEDEKFRILRMCDIYASTSQHEGFGLVFLEAMACGLPIICYNHGGQTDFLESGATGYLIPLNDLVGFENHCRTLMKEAGLRATMGRENLQRVEDLFIDRCGRRYESVFQDAISAHRRAHAVGDASRA